MGYRVVVAGATGNVGREMLNILAERQFPADEIAAVASSRSQGDIIDFGETGKTLKVQNIEHFDWKGWDIALFAIGSEATKIHAPIAAAAGCTVIDNSSLYRMDPDVPLIVPEVNPEAIAGYTRKNIIANPNCSTAQMVVALKPLHDAAKIKRVVVATYQSVSGAGKAGMDELFEQSRNIFVGDTAEAKKFTKQIAFNVIPHIDSFLEDGSTKEEWKMVVETKKILDPKIKVTATCVRVPVFVGHSEAINIEFEDEISAAQAQKILREAPGVMLVDKREDGGYVTPVECVGDYATFVSRVREDSTVDNGLSLWCVSDNLRKGAALNAVQIAELLGRRHLQKGGLTLLDAWRALPARQRVMLVVLAGAVVLANIAQPYPEVAPLQHIPTVVLLLAAPFLLRRWPLSDGAVGAVTAFFLLHTLAGRYTYSNVPYDAWAHALTGHTISETFGLARNGFDRVVHLMFGVLAVPFYAEAMQRYTGASRRAALWNALLFVGMVSAAYEIFEWLLTMVVAPEMAADYNGQQGDPWDSQKDMAMAIIGAILAVVPRWRMRR